MWALLLTVWVWVAKLGNCQACQAAHNRIMVGGLCVCMDGFYDAGSQNCPACSPLCLTCTSTSTTCTGCNSALHLTLSGTTCICMDGYVMVLGICQPCHYSCRTCSGLLSTNCLTCDTTIRQFVAASTSCVCLNTTYDDTTLQSCLPCNAKCLWCSASTSNDCTACDSNLLRALGPTNPGPCLCYAGYYDATPPLCPQCSYTCATCTLSSNTCSSCNTLNYRSLVGTSCLCIGHYYETNTPTCSQCSPRCGNCSTTATACTTCNNTLRRLVGTNCPCIDGYYEDSATITCLACTSYCNTCQNTSSTCLSCYGYGNRALYNATCPCITGYYDNGTIYCLVCPYECLTCVGPDPPSCSSCDSLMHRALSGGSCPCVAGYFDSGIALCQQCWYSCQTCSLSATMCTSCDSSAHRMQVATDCNCTVGFYDDGLHAVCLSCHYSCISCFGGTNTSCYTCQLNRNYTNYSCPCFLGMYELAQQCYNCDVSCATCTINSTYCTACPPSRTLTNGNCLCSTGYFADGLLCSPCSPQCLTCSLTSTTCTSCNLSQGTVLSSSTCTCLDGYYKNITTFQCERCHFSCKTCLSSLPTECISCETTNNRVLTVNSCPCTAGYFESGSPPCVRCHSNCRSCFGPSEYNCSNCVGGYVLVGSYCRYNLTCLNYLYNGACVNRCPDGAYGFTSAGTNICLPCTNNCLTCTTSTYCLTCSTRTYLDISTHTCVPYCPLGSYLTPDRACIVCPSNCSRCTYGTTGVVCTECVAGYQIRDGGHCVSACMSGFISVAGRCHKCVGNCLTCLSLAYNGCSTCLPAHYLLGGVCYATCPLGYTSTFNQCTPCPTACSSCLWNACLSCSANFYLSADSECIAVGYFRNANEQILQCHPNCKSCTDTSFSSCLLCSQHRGDSSEFAVSGYCECKLGSIDTGDGNCDVVVYQDIIKANDALIGGTEAILFMTIISSIVSANYVPLFGLINYLQVYSLMYYLNSSAVMQTDIILQSYQNIHPITFYRSTSSPSPKRLLFQTQTSLSLFLRGRQWEYLIQWAFPAFLLNCLIWGVALLLCCCSRNNNKVENVSKQHKEGEEQKCSPALTKEIIIRYASSFKEGYLQSAPIGVFLATYPEIMFYSAFSFKALLNVQLKLNGFQLSQPKLVLSIIICAYYIIYLIRLLVGCYRYNPQSSVLSKGTKNSLRLLFHEFKILSKSKLSKMFIPLQVSRNFVISILIVFLAHSPNYQAFSSLILLGAFLLLNLCICPYKGAARIYFHLCDLLLVIQVGVLTYITALPEKSRIGPSQALIILNFVQLLLIFMILCWVLVVLVATRMCSNKKQKKSVNKQTLVNEQSLSNLAEKEEYQEKRKQILGLEAIDNNMTKQPVVSPIYSSQTQQRQPSYPAKQSGCRSEKKTSKKYRIRHKI